MTLDEAIAETANFTPEERAEGDLALALGIGVGTYIVTHVPRPSMGLAALEMAVATVVLNAIKPGHYDEVLKKLFEHVLLQIEAQERGREAAAMGEAQGRA